MAIFLRARWLMVSVSLLIGSLLGASVGYAHVFGPTTMPDGDGTLSASSHAFEFPNLPADIDYNWDQDNNIEANLGQTEFTVYDTGVWNGEADADEVETGVIYIYDQNGTQYTNPSPLGVFVCQDAILNGMDRVESTHWNGTIGSNNPYVIHEFYIYKVEDECGIVENSHVHYHQWARD